MAHDALGAHVRDDIGITEALTARPLQPAIVSSFSFTLGGVVPLLASMVSPQDQSLVIAGVSLVFLAALGGPIVPGRTLALEIRSPVFFSSHCCLHSAVQ
jgi:VIT1/CCC1 family predicted Fe2+/Mn2+ transporter